jgi:hypothetical protein
VEGDWTTRDAEGGGGQHHVLSDPADVELILLALLHQDEGHRGMADGLGEVTTGG